MGVWDKFKGLFYTQNEKEWQKFCKTHNIKFNRKFRKALKEETKKRQEEYRALVRKAFLPNENGEYTAENANSFANMMRTLGYKPSRMEKK